MFFMYANDMVPCANTLGDVQKLTRALEEFCTHTKLTINRSKTNITFVKSQNKDKPHIMYNNKPQALNTLALKFFKS